MGELVVNNLVALRRLVHAVEATSEEKRADVELKWLLQQVRCGELATVRLPIARQQFLALLVLRLSQRPRGVVIVPFEMGEERLKRERRQRNQRIFSSLLF